MSTQQKSICSLFGLFDAIYVINLAKRTDRLVEMEAELKRVGLSLATPGVLLFSAVRPDDAGPFESIGARGSFMSHLLALEDAVAKGLSRVLILEDDCNFSADWVARLSDLASVWPNESWSIFYGGTLTTGMEIDARNGFTEVMPEQPLFGNHCYCVAGSALPKMTQYFRQMLLRPPGHPEGGPMHVDGAYSWFRRAHPNFRTVLAVPYIAYQRSSRTDIHALKWFDRFPLVKRVIGLIRHLKNVLRPLF